MGIRGLIFVGVIAFITSSWAEEEVIVVPPAAKDTSYAFRVLWDDDRDESLVKQGSFADPREALLKKAERSASEEIFRSRFLPQLTKLISEGAATDSPALLYATVLKVVTEQLRQAEPALKKNLLADRDSRTMVYLVAPWERSPMTSGEWIENSRFSPRREGFDPSMRTPIIDFAGKNWVSDENDSAVAFGRPGNLGGRISDYALKRIAIPLAGAYESKPYSVQPPYFPLALLFQVKFSKTESTKIVIQLLMGLQPGISPLEPKESGPVIVHHTGIPQPAVFQEVGRTDRERDVPVALMTYRHDLAEAVREIPVHVNCGLFELYDIASRELKVQSNSEAGAWKLAPFIGMDLKLGKIKGPMRVHLTEFDIYVTPGAKDEVVMKNLKTGIELYKGDIGLRIAPDGLPFATDYVANQAIGDINKEIASQVEAAKKQKREEAQKRFPMAKLLFGFSE